MSVLAWPLRWLDDAGRDLRHAWRLLFHAPVVTSTAALSLAIGIGATITAVAVADALLFKAPPGVSEPASLVDIGSTRGGAGFGPSSYRDYLDIRARASTLVGVYAYSRFPAAVSVRGDGQAERGDASLVTTNFFTTLGAVRRSDASSARLRATRRTPARSWSWGTATGRDGSHGIRPSWVVLSH